MIKIDEDSCEHASSHDLKERNTDLRNNYQIVVYFGKLESRLRDLSQFGVTEVNVSVDGVQAPPKRYSFKDIGIEDKRYIAFPFLESDFGGNIKNGALVKVSIAGYPGRAWHFRFKRTTTPYATFESVPYAWLPVALFSTNFKSNEEGISLAPMPIGLGLGTRINTSKGRYLGISAVGSWLIAPEKKATDAEKPSGNFNFKQITLGGILDLSNFAYVGYAYGLDLTSKHNHQGHLLVVGIAPGALQLFQGTP